MVGVIRFGGIEVDQGTIEIGTLFAFMQYIAQILMGVLMASFMVIMIPRAAVSAERIGEVLASESTLTLAPSISRHRPSRVARRRAYFRDVEFSYLGAEGAGTAGHHVCAAGK